ncbi:hypothetical protein U14_01002 [Candidatus Moduliflexus flocculans]|uniref:Uncharacterized protein n=1 Tax=Candidatus Moduliflexus flocculans TaxID=1499966 RepID=A0A0S6VRH1_9BACT|nr:hypothetical protein U14_01002 [Candidatus Moduliflexus flocculans]
MGGAVCPRLFWLATQKNNIIEITCAESRHIRRYSEWNVFFNRLTMNKIRNLSIIESQQRHLLHGFQPVTKKGMLCSLTGRNMI